MITAWILYAVLVGALVGAGALALEHLLRSHGITEDARRYLEAYRVVTGNGVWPQVGGRLPA